jgi:hypothetical protein
MANNYKDGQRNSQIAGAGGLRESDYELAWGCSRFEVLYSTPVEEPGWNPDSYDYQQRY